MRRIVDLPSRLSLVSRFALVSAALAGGLAVVLAGWLTNLIRTNNVGHARATATYSMDLSLETVGITSGQTSTLSTSQYLKVTRLLRAMVATGNYVGATAWSGPTTVVYAAPADRIGSHEGSRPQLAQALAGTTTTTVVRRPSAGVPDVTERAGLASSGPLLEVFVPVRLDNRVVAAVEFYQRWDPIQQTIDSQIRTMLMLVLTGIFLLWLALVRFVITASRKLKAQVAAYLELASRDPLTGLPNRKVFRGQVDRTLAEAALDGSHTGLLLLDLDRFKEVNDTLGHSYGDLLLQQVGPRLRAVLRQGDSIARLGGDEFVVLLADIDDVSMASEMAQRLVTAISAPFDLDSVHVVVEVSVGVALSPQHGLGFDDLLQHADIAMYEAKAARTGFAVYSPAGDTASTGKLAMLGELRAAIEEPSQLVLVYQPKADLVTGEVRGVEALVRWEHPTDGLKPPSEFIPLAERTGLIRPLTIRVLEQALSQIRLWNQVGMRLTVAVNISTRCLDLCLPDLVGRLLQDNEVSANQLELEITESAIMADPDRAVDVVTRLQELGVGLSIDDFGTGYSSMSYLQRLPVGELKIDQSFVTNMTPGSTDAAIVRSCIELARNLGMIVVAEGVETAAVWNQLTELGCDLAQGYFLAKPMAADIAFAWMLERRERNGSIYEPPLSVTNESIDGLRSHKR